jgi:hypothetical protein
MIPMTPLILRLTHICRPRSADDIDAGSILELIARRGLRASCHLFQQSSAEIETGNRNDAGRYPMGKAVCKAELSAVGGVIAVEP